MYKKIALAAIVLSTGIGFQPAPADAKNGLIVEVGHGRHHGQGHRRGHGRRHHRAQRYWKYTQPYWYGSYCRWEQRPHRVRVWDDYYGRRHTTIWRPVRICR